MNARAVVLQHLASMARRFPDLPAASLTHEHVTAQGPDDRDAALAVAIDQAVMRYWSALAHLAQVHLSRPWDELEPAMQAALLAGTAQLLLMDRVPDHAAIDETVEWVKNNVRFKAGGLINAVLRRTSEMRESIAPTFDPTSRRELPLPDGRAVRFTTDVFHADPITRLAQQTSHPLKLLQGWAQRWGRDQAQQIALHDLIHAPIIVTSLNPDGAANGDGLFPYLSSHDRPGFFVFTGDKPLLQQLLTTHPTARVQDPASAMPVASTGDLSPKLIVDFCAGRGTKTRQLAALHPSATVIAADVNAERRGELHRQFADNPPHVPAVHVAEPDELLDYAGRADLLVLDVPCSNTGVLARRLEARHRYSDRSVKQLIDLQRQIAADALRLVPTHGHVLYCTCSIEPMENEQQVQWLNKWHQFHVTKDGLTLPAALPGQAAGRYHDGGYFALLAR